MIKRQLSVADFLLIAANLVPVYGVWFLDWPPTEAFIVYALETLIIGFLTVIKLLTITVVRGSDDWYNRGSSTKQHGLFFIFFFIMHFGIFALVQTTIFAQSAKITPPGSGMFHFFFHWPYYINADIAIMLYIFVAGYIAKNFIPFIWNKEYKTKSMMLVMFEPYGRIFIQQFTVIIGSMFLAMGFGKGFILVFALVKIFFDLFVDYGALLRKAGDKMKQDSVK